MYRYSNTLLEEDDKIFLKEKKQKLLDLGYKQASMSKIIKYGVEELKTKKFESIVTGMVENKIINDKEKLYDNS